MSIRVTLGGASWYWGLLLLIVAARAILAGYYLVRTAKKPTSPELRGWRALVAAFQQTTTEHQLRSRPDLPASQITQRHAALLEAARRQEDSILILGSLALAAWTQLYAAAGTSGSFAARLSDTTRALLFVGVLGLIVGSVLFRAEGSHVTYMGRDLMRSVGYAALAFSLASAIHEVFAMPAWVGVAIAITITTRELAKVMTLLRLDRSLFNAPVQPPAKPTPVSQPDPTPIATEQVVTETTAAARLAGDRAEAAWQAVEQIQHRVAALEQRTASCLFEQVHQPLHFFVQLIENDDVDFA
jgi:hypothetical protein